MSSRLFITHFLDLSLLLFLSLPCLSSFLETEAALNNTDSVVHTMLRRCNHLSSVRIISVSDNWRLINKTKTVLFIYDYIPCLPKNKTGLISIFTLKYDIEAYFWGMFFIFIYLKTKLQSKELLLFSSRVLLLNTLLKTNPNFYDVIIFQCRLGLILMVGSRLKSS